MRRASVWTLFVVTAAPLAAPAQELPGEIIPAAVHWRPRPPATSPYQNCPPNSPPWVPGTSPGMPRPPGTPGDPGSPTPPMVPPNPPGQPQPGQQPPDQPRPGDPAADRMNNLFAVPTEGGGQRARSFNENFDGDFGGVSYVRNVVVGSTAPQIVGFTEQVSLDANGNKVVTRVPIVQPGNPNGSRTVRIPLGSRYNGIKITDNDNPRPQDRLYFGYNYFDQINRSLNPGVGDINLHRETIGFEKTFLDGDASFGLRLPFIQQTGSGQLDQNVVGDLNILFKFAIINNRRTGDLLSAGLVLTTPTGGGDAVLVDGTLAPHSVLFQPWVGGVLVRDRGYAQMITSMIIPTDSRDPTLFNNSIALGYWAYQADADRMLTGVIPVVEVHVRTPLTQRDTSGVIFLQDQVNITTGVHFRGNRVTFSPAVCIPVVGPRPWALEAMGYLNYRF